MLGIDTTPKKVKHDETPRIPTRKDMEPSCGVKRELDPAGHEPPKKKRQKETRHSRYVGVRWNDECKKWYASLHANGKHHYCGLYEHEGDAARAVNAKCCELVIPHKNKGLGVIQIRKKNKRSSRKSAYKGIYWVEKSQSWQVKIKYHKKLHSGGTFQDEYLAAQAANLLCVKLNIPQKNAEIGVNDILEKMKDGKIPPRRPRPRRKSKNNGQPWSRNNINKVKREVKREQGSHPIIPMALLFPSEHSPNSFSSLAEMSAQEVADWLRDLRFLDKYIDQFLLCEVTGIELVDVDEILLADFGLPKLFQKRLLRCIEQLSMSGFRRHFPSNEMAPTFPPFQHMTSIITVTPVKLEDVPLVPVTTAPPALEIPQIKQEKIDQQVYHTIFSQNAFMVLPSFGPTVDASSAIDNALLCHAILESTQKITADPARCVHFNEPERIVERTEKGQLKIRWKGFGPEDDTEELVEKFEGFDVYKEFLQREEEEKKGKRKRGRPKKKTCEICP